MAFSARSPRRGQNAPPNPTSAQPGQGWGVRGTVRMAFPEPPDQPHDSAYAARLDLYIQDMLREHKLDPAADDHGRAGWSYSDMAAALIEQAVPANEGVDLLILAYAVPDISPGRNMAAQISSLCPGAPLAFGLTDQGAAAPFTSLRLMREYARAGGLRRALLLVVEQAALPYDASGPIAKPDGHTGIALLLGDTPTDPDAAPALHLGPIITHAGTREEALTDEIASLCIDAPETTVILAAALADQTDRVAAAGADRLRIASPGRPYTGVWWELADELQQPASSPRRVVLCDYDPLQRCLCLAVLDTGRRQETLNGTRCVSVTAPSLAGS